MPAVIVQKQTFSTGTGTPASVDAVFDDPTGGGTQVFVIPSGDATIATPSGFTLDDSQINNNGHYVYRKSSGAGGEDTFTVTPSVSASVSGCMLEVAGLTSSPVDQVVSAGSGTGATTRSTGTTGTTTQADEWLLATIGSSNTSGATSSVDSFTNSFAEVAGLDVCTNKAAGTNVGCAVATRTVAATATYETTATFAAAAAPASTGILITYKIAGGLTGVIGQITETDTAQAVGRASTTTIGQVSETDTAQAVTHTKVTTVGLVTGTDTALAVTAIGPAPTLNINPNPPPAIGGAVAHNLPTLAGTIS